nr:alpha/beta fold hydrolase [uncultured Cohaesibacter sp.]
MFRNLKISCYALSFVLAASILAVAPTVARASAPEAQAKERVVLVHGLGRTRSSMWLLSARLEDAGYQVFRIGYHSLRDDPETIRKDVARQIDACCANYAGVTHFVGHSLGGLVIRAYLDQTKPANLGRVVLLGTPSYGTKVVDNLKEYEWFRWLGPTTLSLGTDISQYPDGEQKPDYSLGVIAGLSGPISRLNDPLLPGDDDGLVSVESTKIEGMKDFLVVQSSHAGLRYSKGVAEQVIHFLRTESFYRPETQGNATNLKFEWEYF